MRWATLLVLAAACGDNLPAAPDGGVPAHECTPAEPRVVEPLWIAGQPGSRAEVGAIGKVDAVVIHNGLLLAGDEDPDFEEVHIYDVYDDDPEVRGDLLPPLADLGADPGPAGTGPLEFAGVSGFAPYHPRDDEEPEALYIVEQGNARVQRVLARDLRAPPYYVFDRTVGARADDPDQPADGEFVRLQAARVDLLGRLYLSDDARGQAAAARRDIQVFSPDGDYLFKLGDITYGSDPGEDGRLGEPENFALDEAHNRIYVCDELTREIVIYRYDDRAFIGRFGVFTGIPNGIDVDGHGVIYVLDEGNDAESWVRLFDPDTLAERWRFGARSEPDDPTPGAFNSADTLYINRALDLLVVADQGHDRVQGFSLSEVQGLACVESATLRAPAAVRSGDLIPLVLQRFGPDGAPDRAHLRETATLSARRVADGARVPIDIQSVSLVAGAGVAAVVVNLSDRTEVELVATLGGVTATARVTVGAADDERTLSGTLGGADLRVGAGQAVVVNGTATVPAGATLTLEPGSALLLDAGARMVVDGALRAEGTAERPVRIAAAAATPWAQIHLRGAPSLLRHSFVTGGGDTERLGHCCGAMLRVQGADLVIEDSVITGADAKALFAEAGASIRIERSAIARLAMGVELDRSDGVVAESWLFGFTGPDDNDAIYLRGEDRHELTGVVLADADDDLLDTLAASPTVRRAILLGAADKAMSLDAGDPIIEDTLIAGAARGIAIKNIRTARSTATVRRTTITGAGSCVEIFEADGAVVRPRLERAIVWDCGTAFVTGYDPADITVEDSVVDEVLSGMTTRGNSNADPLFLDPPRDYRTHPLSPARPAGEGGDVAGWPGP